MGARTPRLGYGARFLRDPDTAQDSCATRIRARCATPCTRACRHARPAIARHALRPCPPCPAPPPSRSLSKESSLSKARTQTCAHAHAHAHAHCAAASLRTLHKVTRPEPAVVRRVCNDRARTNVHTNAHAHPHTGARSRDTGARERARQRDKGLARARRTPGIDSSEGRATPGRRSFRRQVRRPAGSRRGGRAAGGRERQHEVKGEGERGRGRMDTETEGGREAAEEMETTMRIAKRSRRQGG